jgi:DNA replication protein DnaC
MSTPTRVTSQRLPAQRTNASAQRAVATVIDDACRILQLPTIRFRFEDLADTAQRERATYKDILADLLRLAELGYLDLDKAGAKLLFQDLTEREEQRAIAIASNAPFSEWKQTFTDAAPLGDRGPRHLQRPHHRDRRRLLPPRPDPEKHRH